MQIHHHHLHLNITTMSPSSSSYHRYNQHQYKQCATCSFFCPTASAPYPLSPYPLRPRLPPNPMPGPHLDVAIFQCHRDVGGSDVRISSYHLNEEQWWVGWHTTSPSRRWFSGQETWTLIGYEKWRHWSHGHLTEVYYAEPNPSLTPGPDLTPVGHWRVAYDHQGELIEEA